MDLEITINDPRLIRSRGRFPILSSCFPTRSSWNTSVTKIIRTSSISSANSNRPDERVIRVATLLHREQLCHPRSSARNVSF
jgi:hypothetical protein